MGSNEYLKHTLTIAIKGEGHILHLESTHRHTRADTHTHTHTHTLKQECVYLTHSLVWFRQTSSAGPPPFVLSRCCVHVLSRVSEMREVPMVTTWKLSHQASHNSGSNPPTPPLLLTHCPTSYLSNSNSCWSRFTEVLCFYCIFNPHYTKIYDYSRTVLLK